jgi:thiol:disulfide interchange protein
MRVRLNLFYLALLVCPIAASAAGKTEASLILSAESARPGDGVVAGVLLKMPPGWHTYWKNSGDSGSATRIDWDLPAGITPGEIQWPVPEKHLLGDLTTYVYHDQVLLMVPLKLDDSITPGTIDIKAKVSWLECDKECIIGNAAVAAKLNLSTEHKDSKNSAFIQEWQKKLPVTEPNIAAIGRWEKASQDRRPFVIEWKTKETAPDFFPYAAENFEVEAKTEVRKGSGGKVLLRKAVNKFEGDWPGSIAGILVHATASGETRAYEVTLPLDSKGPAGSVSSAGDGIQSGPAKSLWLMLVLGFVGGLILNVMPCVLPVLSLKILGLVNQGKETASQVRKLGLVYTGGVVVSFLILAGIVIAVQGAGAVATWGMQFQNPQFLVLMTVLLVLVALNLFGVFEVNIGGKALGTASSLAGREGLSGAFFHGVLITALATPCTAPFLGAAIGFAFAQPPATVVVMFVAIALGLAFPYLLLSFQPKWARFLPKPGAWMERFKIAMGFPLLGTAVWLFSLSLSHFGPDGALWIGLFLVVVAVAAWIFGEFVQRGRARKPLAVAISVALLAAGYVYTLEKEVKWRAPVYAGSAGANFHSVPGGIEWNRWSVEAVAAAREAGHPVLVDFTARWCPNCLWNKRTSIEIQEVREKMIEINAVAMIGDFTNSDPEIAAELRRHERAGVPLVLVYPADTNEPPEVLPEILTPGIVLKALERAANKTQPQRKETS